MPVDLRRAVIDLELRPDGTVSFHVSGLPGADCEQVEAILLELLRGEVTGRTHTHERFQQASQGLVGQLRALLGRGG